MRLCYILLSPTFGMHQYTADLANRLVVEAALDEVDVHLVTTNNLPADRYSPVVNIHAPITTTDTGLSLNSLRLDKLGQAKETLRKLQPDLVHFTGPHLWNVALMNWLRRQGVPVVHSIHDLDPHNGGLYGWLLRRWNRRVVSSADRVLVHGETYRRRLLQQGLLPEQVISTPLLFLFLNHKRTAYLAQEKELAVSYEHFALFFGRLEQYKGIGTLLTAWSQISSFFEDKEKPRLVLAGPGQLASVWDVGLPEGVELRNRFIDDEEALDLFRRCSLVVLPYTAATQSALIAAAYYFRKPVLVTYSGALPEYVIGEQTGFVVQPNHPPSLARGLRAAFADRERLMVMGQAGRAWYDRERERGTAVLRELYSFEREVEEGELAAA